MSAFSKLIFSLLIVMMLTSSPSLAWNPPDGDGRHASFGENDYYMGYHKKTHAYIIERAMEILKNDQKENWAGFAGQFQYDLIDGVRWADRCDEQLRVVVYNDFCWGLIRDEAATFPLCNYASLQHFYDPVRNIGLDLSGYHDLAEFFTALGASFTGLVTGGFYFTDIEVLPGLQLTPYPSAVDRCQQEYDHGIQAYHQTNPMDQDRSVVGSAMFHLGWACHFLGDMGVSPHTFNSFIGHGDYENVADNKGHDPQYNASSGGEYQDWSARDYGVNLANISRSQQEMYVSHDWDNGVRQAIPVTERYTAGLIAKFMSEAGVPPRIPDLQGQVRDTDGKAIPNASIFYQYWQGIGSSGQIISGRWNVLRTDSEGRYTLSLTPNRTYCFRPAMPGYAWECRTDGPGMSDIPQCPVLYTHQGGAQAPVVDFYLKPLAGGSTAQPVPAVGAASPVDNTVKALLDVSAGDYLLAARATPHDEEPTPRTTGEPLSLYKSTKVHIRLYHFMDVTTGKLAQSSQDVQRAINSALPAQQSIPPTSSAQPKPGLLGKLASIIPGMKPSGQAKPPTHTLPAGQPTPPQALLAIHRLGMADAATSDGKSHSAVVLPAVCGGRDLEDSAYIYGLMPLPAAAGAKIQVEVLKGYGSIGLSGTQPLVIETSADGLAGFVIKSGSQTGTLRLRIKVLSDPAGGQIVPETTVEFQVCPDHRGSADVQPVIEPVLAPLPPQKSPLEEKLHTPLAPEKVITPGGPQQLPGQMRLPSAH